MRSVSTASRTATGLALATAALWVAGLLGMWVIESISIAVDQWFGSRADPTSPVVSSALVVPFLVIALIGSIPLLVMLRSSHQHERERVTVGRP